MKSSTKKLERSETTSLTVSPPWLKAALGAGQKGIQLANLFGVGVSHTGYPVKFALQKNNGYICIGYIYP